MPSSDPAAHTGCNIVVLRGRLSSEPRVRELPSGSSVTQLELTTRQATGTSSVPVAVDSDDVGVASGDDVVVIGHVRRRFFRAGGVTQARTEVVAASVLPVRRQRAVERALNAVIESLNDVL